MMLVACLTFGCSISSISYRRQEFDRYQTVFLFVVICVACTLGAISGSNPNLIMLGYVPWGLCVAIVASALSHWAMRQCGMKTGKTHNDLEDNKQAW
jgi:O-antigen/teichoic acid export membrane protein